MGAQALERTSPTLTNPRIDTSGQLGTMPAFSAMLASAVSASKLQIAHLKPSHDCAKSGCCCCIDVYNKGCPGQCCTAGGCSTGCCPCLFAASAATAAAGKWIAVEESDAQ